MQITSKNTLASDFSELANASLRISGRLLDALTPEQQTGVQQWVQCGAKLSIEFGPLPEFQRAQMVLTEQEGMRHVLVQVELNLGDPK